MTFNPEAAIEKVGGEVKALEAKVDTHIAAEQKWWRQSEKRLDTLDTKVDRPSLPLSLVMNLLSGLVGALSVWALTH